MKYIYCYPTPFGEMSIIEENHAIVEIKFDKTQVIGEIIISETPLIHQTYEELTEYWAGNRTTFSIPLNPKGTPFQKKVWASLLKIPYGKTKSYQQIATEIGNKKASRAVGSANHNNPIPIIIPCHRVIASNGKLTGYAFGIEMKKKLLLLEKTRSE